MKIDIVDIISIIAILLSVVSLFILLIGYKKTMKTKNKFLKYLPMILVFIIIGSIISVYYYYNYEMESDTKKFYNLAEQMDSLNIDYSLTLPNAERKMTLDSLLTIRKEMSDILDNLQKQEKAIGENLSTIQMIESTIKVAGIMAERFDEYNEVANYDFYSKKLSTYSVSGNTSNLIFICPEKTDKDYVTLHLMFKHGVHLEDIEVICIEVLEIKDEKTVTQLMSRYYKPKENINLFNIKNYFKDYNNTQLLIGYFLKDDMSGEAPRFHKITCNYPY